MVCKIHTAIQRDRPKAKTVVKETLERLFKESKSSKESRDVNQ